MGKSSICTRCYGSVCVLFSYWVYRGAGTCQTVGNLVLVRQRLGWRGEWGDLVTTDKTSRIAVPSALSTLVFALLVCAIAGLSVSSAVADTRWYDPVTLTSHDGAGSFDVVLAVTPVASGAFEYVYWVKNNGAQPLCNFYYTCFGSQPLSSFTWATPLSGVYDQTTGHFTANGNYEGWGWYNSRNRPLAWQNPDLLHGSEFAWMALSVGGPNETSDSRLANGHSMGFVFTSPYEPEDPSSVTPSDIASGTVVIQMSTNTYGSEDYVYGPSGETPSAPAVPEWSSILLAMSGLGCTLLRRVGARRRS